MKLPRWLRSVRAQEALHEMDIQYARQHKNGPMVIVVHYRDGKPMTSQIRDWIVPPAILEFSITISTSS